MRRSREGAWIEITIGVWLPLRKLSRSREGARIEIIALFQSWLSVRSRSREGARIEMTSTALSSCPRLVAPARERGLKSFEDTPLSDVKVTSLPRGSED